MPIISFLVPFLSGKPHLPGVDDNNKITRIQVGGEDRFVLPTQDIGDIRGQPSENLALRIDQVPALLDEFFFSGCMRFHSQSNNERC